MKISIGSDHAGFKLKNELIPKLEELGYDINDVGTHSEDSCDYPDYAKLVASAVSKNEADRGILICGTGIGMSMTANRFKGIRAALCFDVHMARLTSEHNKSNILCMNGKKSLTEALDMIEIWINTPFGGGRHQRRIDKIEL